MKIEKKSYKTILRDSFDNSEASVSPEQRYNLATELLRTGRVLSDNMIKIASMLNRRPEDYYYITYGLLMQFRDRLIENSDGHGNELSQEQKSDALEEACQIIQENVENKEFMDQIYKDIRLGSNIAKVYYPKQLKKDLIQIKNFDLMLNKLKTSERF